jgi:hypothetical protein
VFFPEIPNLIIQLLLPYQMVFTVNYHIRISSDRQPFATGENRPKKPLVQMMAFKRRGETHHISTYSISSFPFSLSFLTISSYSIITIHKSNLPTTQKKTIKSKPKKPAE